MALIFAVMHLYNILIVLLLLYIPFLYLKKKSGIDKSTEWFTMPACPSLMRFFNRGNTVGTNSSKILCLMFVYVLFYVYVGSDFVVWGEFVVMTCVQSK